MGQQQKKKRRGWRRSGQKVPEPDLPPLPDFCAFPPIEDVGEALLSPLGSLRSCARRAGCFLDAIQERLDGLEAPGTTSIEEVVSVVEAEFWTLDPLFCLWEEIALPRGDSVRYRLGPFAVCSDGTSVYTADGVDEIDWLRVPLWTFCPTPAHFRCMAEWNVLSSDRLKRELPLDKAVSKKTGKRRREVTRPCREAFAAALAGHVAMTVDRNEESRGVFARFVEFYRDPRGCLARHASDPAVASADSSSPACFVSSARRLLLGESERSMPGLDLAKFHEGLWGSSAAVHAEAGCLPVLCRLGEAINALANPTFSILPKRNSDWIAACVLYHFRQLRLQPATVCSASSSIGLQDAGHALGRAMRAFALEQDRVERAARRAARLATAASNVNDTLNLPPQAPLAIGSRAEVMYKGEYHAGTIVELAAYNVDGLWGVQCDADQKGLLTKSPTVRHPIPKATATTQNGPA